MIIDSLSLKTDVAAWIQDREVNNLLHLSEPLHQQVLVSVQASVATTSDLAATHHSAISLMHHTPHHNSPDRQTICRDYVRFR
jgi:hypothetical protein